MRTDFVLHPLIHILALATILLDLGASEKRQQCGLKYVISTLSEMVGEL